MLASGQASTPPLLEPVPELEPLEPEEEPDEPEEPEEVIDPSDPESTPPEELALLALPELLLVHADRAGP
jgi:hypothetical protein